MHEPSRLRQLRQQRGLTLQGMAARAQTSTATLVFIELYGHVPGPNLRQRIALALQVDEQELWPEPIQSTTGSTDAQ